MEQEDGLLKKSFETPCDQQLRKDIAEAIRGIDSMECGTLLEMRYLTFLSWDQIAAQLDYSVDYIYHLHRKALSLVKHLPA